MTLVYSPLIVLSLDSHINICLIELLLWANKHTIHCNLSEHWKIRFTYFSASVLPKFSELHLSIIYLFGDNYFVPTKYFTTLEIKAFNLANLLAYVSRWFILLPLVFLLQLSELFLFPTFKQDSRNIIGKRISVLAFLFQSWDILISEKLLSHIFDIRRPPYLRMHLILKSNNFSEETAYCRRLIEVQIIL